MGKFLTIIRNGTDESGKGIRESEAKLAELLPDLNKDLLSSCVIIGQGMPNKFSSFTPSGRKELLEKLTKSDYMINDLKQRVQQRTEQMSATLRTFEDSILVNSTQLKTAEAMQEANEKELANAVRPDYDTEMAALEAKLEELSKTETELNKKSAETDILINTTMDELKSIMAEFNTELQSMETAYQNSITAVNTNKITLEAEIRSLNAEINRLKNISDICPTCKRKLPGILKPDYSAKETELSKKQEEVKNLSDTLSGMQKKHDQYAQEIKNKYNDSVMQHNDTLAEAKKVSAKIKQDLAEINKQTTSNSVALTKLTTSKMQWDSYIANLTKNIEDSRFQINNLKEAIALSTDGKNNTDGHLAVLKKMDTLLKRDFRGYLLENIIDYLNTKSKAYCKIVFGTTDLELAVDGNALEISYAGKMFDNLSGGEKQRVDLILQFAIRDLLYNYLGISSNILVLDEITDFLDKQSCAAVMKLIEQELATTESVFIVSHHADELEIPIDSELHVIKNANGLSEVF